MAIESLNAVDTSSIMSGLNKTNQSLTSGSQINSAADNAAGSAIVASLSSKINTQDIGIQNATMGGNLLQTADGATSQITEQLQRLSELSIQSLNGTYNSSQRAAMNAEFQQGLNSINSFAESSSFNGMNLLNGQTTAVDIALGSGNTASLSLPNLTLDGLGLTGADISNPNNALAFQTQLQDALGIVSESQAQFGAQQNGLSASASNLANQNVNAQGTRSQINDTNYASAVSDQARLQVLNQTSLAMQAQNNQNYSNVLSLLN